MESGSEIETLVQALGRLPGLGPRSARRATLALLKRRDALLRPLMAALHQAADRITDCSHCGNLDTVDPCTICRDQKRDRSLLCVVEDVSDLWAIERAAVFRGTYHVLGGTLSALDGIGPEELNLPRLLARAGEAAVQEVVVATGATVDGQTTAHYLAERLRPLGVMVTRPAHGVPVGGELGHLDDGTLAAALGTRQPLAL